MANVFFISETSSLNVFWMENGKLRLSTANTDIPAPFISGITKFPTQRTSKKYEIEICKHEFVSRGQIQIRRGDEASSDSVECRFCKLRRIIS